MRILQGSRAYKKNHDPLDDLAKARNYLIYLVMKPELNSGSLPEKPLNKLRKYFTEKYSERGYLKDRDELLKLAIDYVETPSRLMEFSAANSISQIDYQMDLLSEKEVWNV